MTNLRMPILDQQLISRRLGLPQGRRRVVIDTDAANEIDDQFALVWALQSFDRLEIAAVLAEPYSFAHLRDGLLEAASIMADERTATPAESAMVDSYRSWVTGLHNAGIEPSEIEFVGPAEGMQRSYEEILRVYECVGIAHDGRVFHGSPHYLPAPDQPVKSPAVDRLIELAMGPGDDPLYVVAIGCVTNLASALLVEPEIAKRIVVLWTAGYPIWCPHSNSDALNLVQDVAAARVLFDSGVPLVYFPGYYIGAQLRLSLPEMDTWVRGKGTAGTYLYDLYTNNPLHRQRGITDHFGRTWVMWDMITIAWLIEPDWVPSSLVNTPTLDEQLRWKQTPDAGRIMREAHAIDRDAIFRDFFRKLAAPD